MLIQDQFSIIRNLQMFPIPQINFLVGNFFAASYSKTALVQMLLHQYKHFFSPIILGNICNFVIFCIAYENERFVSLVAQICCKFLLQIIIMRKTKTLKLKTSSHLHNQVCTKFKSRQTSNPNLSIQILEAKVQISFLCCTRNIVCVFF